MSDVRPEGVPEGYSECRSKCGRWAGTVGRCWACITKDDASPYAIQAAASSKYPDFTPAPAVEVGQVWMFGGAEETVYDIYDDQIVTCEVGTKEGDFTHFGRGCCWRYLATMSEGRLVTPAPAKHVERRPGQRWSYRYKTEAPIEHTLGERWDDGWRWADCQLGGWRDNAWSHQDITMILIPEAPKAEAAKSVPPLGRCNTCGTDCAILPNDSRPWDVPAEGCWRTVDNGSGQCRKPAPSEKEPVCLFFGKSKLHVGAVLKRYWRNMHKDVCSTFVCDLHYLENEPSGGGSDILHNDSVAERLPRPRLAHSMGVEDPALENA